MIPTGWKLKPLSEVAIIQTGVAKGPKKLKNPVALPYLRVANVQDGYLDLSTIKTIEIDEAQINRYLLKVGDVLLTEGGDFDKLGRGTVWKGEFDRCVHQNHVFVVRPKASVLLSEYLSLLTGSPYGKLYFMKCSKQSTNLASINSTQLKEFPVLFPSIPEQAAIIDLLSIWDQAIEKAKQLITVKEKRFTWLLNRLINKENTSSKWRNVVLGNVAEVTTGQPAPQSEGVFSESGIPFIRVGCLEYLIDGWSESSFELIEFDIASKYRFRLFPANTILFAKSGMSANIPRIYQLKKPAFLVSHLAAVIPSNEVNPFYLKYWLLLHHPNRLIQGDGFPSIKTSEVAQMHVLVPPMKTQKQIASILNTARQEIDLLKKQLEAYRKQKRGLMQKLLTGTWRVNVHAGSKEGAL